MATTTHVLLAKFAYLLKMTDSGLPHASGIVVIFHPLYFVDTLIEVC